ncbi:hypothetical protein [Cyanobium sp. Lug-B]|uniref:hypothetical protein n=1 Tax=Cyanobium sp. Lug-B TaxID=2823716 RepID=UPI0020CFC922|nr:hypothetical protein [Cyanobium sp. Lug-B]MCP9796106.1 hypothetical protein [Cyanobium sp. Lug-B]
MPWPIRSHHLHAGIDPAIHSTFSTMTDNKEPKKYEPQNCCDPHNIGIPDPRERILTAAEMNDLPKDALIKYAFSKQFKDANEERKRKAEREKDNPAPKTFTEEQLKTMSLTELMAHGFGGGMPGGGKG